MPGPDGKTIGLIVNPIAGMGGAVGLKGTDGPEILARARALDAVPQAGARARRALVILAAERPGARLIVAPGAMGAEVAAGLALDFRPPAGGEPGETTAADTTRAARAQSRAGVAVILFAGGDGTARLIADAVGLDTPILGLPCGVRMHSGVFATSPEAAGRLVADLLAGGPGVRFREAEILDIDEDAARQDRLAARLHGYARIPFERRLIQGPKGAGPMADAAAIAAVGREIAAEMAPGVLYLIGPGSGPRSVTRALGLHATLLGVDAVLDGRLVGRDLGERDLARLAEGRETRIVVGVIGGQGFVFGRGNQQLSAPLIRRAGLIVIAGAEKLSQLSAPRLLLDTGDPALDAELAGYVRVRTAPGRTMMMRIEP